MKKLVYLILMLCAGKISAQEDNIDPCNIYDLVIILDQSASVRQDFNIACIELSYFFEQINIGEDAGHVAFVTFNNTSSVIHYLSGHRESLVESARVMSLDHASGYTNLYDALQSSFTLLQQSERWHDEAIPKICIVITDGYPNVAPKTTNPLLREDSPVSLSLEAAYTMKQQGIKIHVVSMGCDISEDFLKSLVSADGVISYSDYENLAKTLKEINLCQ